MIKWREPEEKKYFPLTHPQKRVWYTEQLNPGTGLFNIVGTLRIKGVINPTIMEDSARMLIERNDTLRLCVINEDGEPRQYVRELEEFELPVYDFSQEENPLATALQWTKDKTIEPIVDGELVQCFLAKVADDDYIYLQKCHHLICDGWTFAIIKKELETYYRYLLYDEELTGDTQPSYLDFINDEEEYKASKRFQKHRQFWMENFHNLPQAVNLSPNVLTSKVLNGARYSVRLDGQTTGEIMEYVKKASSSVYSFFMALLYTYIYRITGVEDIVIGTPVLNRSNARQKETIGMFVSTMPLRVKVDDQLTFAEFLKVIMTEQRSYYRNQKYPMDLLVKDLELARKGNHKLFEVSLSYQNSLYEQEFDGHPIELEWIFNGYEENSLTIHIQDRNELGELMVELDYALDAFNEEQIQQIARHLLKMAQEVIAEPNTPLWKVQYLEDVEIQKILVDWNQTNTDYPGREKIISNLIEEQVERTPDKLAVVYRERRLTYRELNSLANQLANDLQKRGVGPDKLVGLLLERSVEAIVGIYAILKAGGAYVPIDPEYPDERRSYMLKDSNCRVLLSQTTLKAKIPLDYTGEVYYLDQYLIEAKGESTNLDPLATPDNISYVIYTSGSTGKPKGVMIENRGLTNYIWWAKDYYCPDCECNFPLYSSLSFDLTVTSIFVPLLQGGTIYITGDQKGNLINQVIKQENVNIVKLTPAHLSLIKDQDNTTSTVHKFILGGEDLKAELARTAINSFGGDLEIYNEYGPTETVVGCIVHRFDPTEQYPSVLIGIPIANTQIYILDKYLQPVPPGAVGEIYISGDGVARGYLNRPELTAEKFIANPFISGKRMYRSGDLGRYRLDGKIEYLGRIDNQVKIRGYRIEIGEVEAAFFQHPEIKEVVVDVQIDISDNKYLVGYFVSDKELTVGELRGYLLAKLPEYMVPTHYVQLKEIPLTSNGKVDRPALPEPLGNLATGVDYVAPENEMEIVISQVWAEVLGVDKVGINDNFFELGGDSIKAIQVSTRLKNRGIECKVQDIFTYHTVSQVALHATTDIQKIKAEQGVLEGEVLSTPILNWFFDLDLNNPDYYNQSVLLSLNSTVELSLLEESFVFLIKHHDALRLNYNSQTRRMYYENRYLEENFIIPVIDLSNLENSEQEEKIRIQGERLKSSFNITDNLLIKGVIFALDQSRRKLLLTMHHLIVDGISWRIVLEDLTTIYLQLQQKGDVNLPLKTTSVKEWAEALTDYANSKNSLAAIPYWEETLATGKPVPAELSGTGYGLIADTQFCKVTLKEDETTALLTSANEAYNTKIDDLLLTGLAVTLKDWFNEEQLCIWLEGHGREELFPDMDLSRTLGWFTSLYPTILDLTDCTLLEAKIKAVKEQLRKIPRKGISYGILKYLTKHPFKDDRDLRGVIFNYLGQFDQDLQSDLFSFAGEDTGLEIGRRNQRTSLLEINGMVVDGKLEIGINFSTQRYCSETVKAILDKYLINLREILAHCSDSENFGFTPSDFDTVELSQEDLDLLFG